jgi:hypothetical protein
MTDNAEEKSDEKKSDKYTQALLEVVSSIEAWQDQFGESCISITFEKPGTPKHRKHSPLNSKQARAWIGASFLQKNMGRNIKRLIEDTMQLLEIKAATEGERYEVYTRVAGHEGKIYINLMDNAGRAVEICESSSQAFAASR